MAWWSWIIIGALLLVAELFLVDAAFYLVFIGVAAMTTGLVVLLSLVPLPLWLQWLLFAGLSVVASLLLRERVYRRLRPQAPGFEDDGTGERIVLPQALAPGQECRAPWRGSTWTVCNRGSLALAAGDSARIVARDGLTLDVVGDSEYSLA